MMGFFDARSRREHAEELLTLACALANRPPLVLADGKVIREDHIGSPLEEDLKMWRHAGLGRKTIPAIPQNSRLWVSLIIRSG